MARINVEFNDRKYIIEYNRRSIVKLMESQNEKDSEIESAVKIIYYGLYKNHSNDMPDMDDIYGWIIAMGEQLKPFVEALNGLIQDVLTTVKNEQENKGFKWGVVK